MRTTGQPRSPEWPKVEKAHLAKNPHCACCAPGANLSAGQQVMEIGELNFEELRFRVAQRVV